LLPLYMAATNSKTHSMVWGPSRVTELFRELRNSLLLNHLVLATKTLKHIQKLRLYFYLIFQINIRIEKYLLLGYDAV
jgi:hypothetical protein